MKNILEPFPFNIDEQLEQLQQKYLAGDEIAADTAVLVFFERSNQERR